METVHENIFEWVNLTAVCSMTYIVSIFKIEEYRKKNGILFDKKYRVWASWWFWLLAVYSILTIYFIGDEPFFVLSKIMSVPQIREDEDIQDIKTTIFYEVVDQYQKCFSNERITIIKNCMLGFYVSKLFELVDTYFILLSNRPLILLQWFHHVLTLWYVLYAMIFFPVTGFLFAYVNLWIHSFMYTYLSFSFHPDRKTPCHPYWITFSQILQMVFGLYMIFIQSLVWGKIDYFGFFMYFLYFLLFSEFFSNKYYRKSKIP